MLIPYLLVALFLFVRPGQFEDPVLLDLKFHKELISNCSDHFGSEHLSPSCPGTHVCSILQITIEFHPQRFIVLDAISETLEMSAVLGLLWTVPCNQYNLRGSAHQFYVPESMDIWLPHVHHRNAVGDFGMSNGFSSRLTGTFQDIDTNKRGIDFIWLRTGGFVSACDLDLDKFPFDNQICSVTFLLQDVQGTLSQVTLFQPTSDFIPSGSEWILTNNSVSKGFAAFRGNKSVVNFNYSFKRKPEFYIYTLMVPSFVLTCLELAGFLLPADLPDRSSFSVTTLLAFTVLQSQIVNRIPPKPQRSFLANYTDMCSILAWLCTLYTLGSCAMARTYPQWYRDTFKMKVAHPAAKTLGLTRARAIDLFAFLAAFGLFIAINVYAIHVAQEGGFFA